MVGHHWGSLNPKKCCTIALGWTPNSNGLLQLSKPSLAPDPIPTDFDQSCPPIKVVQMNEGVQYLGVYITGDCTTQPMEAHLWEKVLQYTVVFQKTPMTYWEASILYCACFVATIAYSLPMTWLLDNFFDKIH